MKLLIVFTCLALHLSLPTFSQKAFVKVENQRLTLDGAPYRFIGTNLWYGMNLGAGNKEQQSRLIRELDRLASMGVTNLRIMAASEGPEESPYQNKPILQTSPGVYNEQLLQGLDFLLIEMGKRNMKAVVCLGNFWMWSGGFPQYVSWANNSKIPYPDIAGGSSWDDFISYSESFYSEKDAIKMYHDFIRFLISRQNSISNIPYVDDPTIMAWQLANEPRGYSHARKYRKWIKTTAKLIQSLDPNHLVSVGAEGDTSTKISGTDLYKDNKSKHIDYATTHLWIQNWGWFDPKDTSSFEKARAKALRYLDGQIQKAEKLDKPLVLEEFGVSRDYGNFEVDSDISYRNRFYSWIFSYVIAHNDGPLQGCNFWSWGGEGRPAKAGGFWEEGHDLIGDPAHELQGWYSVYDMDKSTIDIVKTYCDILNE